MNARTVGLPRVVADVTARSSSESNANSTGGLSDGIDAPGGAPFPGAAPPHDPHATAKTRTRTRTTDAASARPLLVALLPDELVFTVREENVEGRERSVAAGHVLLQLHLVFARELRVGVDLLLEDAEPIADHDDLVEERFDRDALLLLALLAGPQDHLAPVPSAREVYGADADLFAD